MTRLGMRHVRTDHRSWDHPLPGADQGDVVYSITRESWLTTVAPPSSVTERHRSTALRNR